MSRSESSLPTAVLLCDHVPHHDALKDGIPGGQIQLVRDLCGRPQHLAAALSGTSAVRLVLGVCGPTPALGEMQAQARQAGFDPLGVERVELPPPGRGWAHTRLRLAAAVARARAFAGSEPEHAKLYLDAILSRRAMLRLSLPAYRAAPAIERARCAADLGCQACVQVCPQGALSWHNGRVSYDKNVCEPCGICVTTCPRQAIHNPAITPAQLEAEVRTLLDPRLSPLQPRGIVFCCQRAPEPEPAWHAGWLPVRLPCVGMAPPVWLLAPLLLGAGAVAALPCSSGCPLRQDARLAGRVSYCRALLHALGMYEGRVSLTPDLSQAPPEAGPLAPIDNPFDPRATAAVLQALRQVAPVSDAVSLRHSQSPLGVITIRESACTGCTRCAQSCPTGALSATDTPDTGLTLHFDPTRCTACGQCLPDCPESEAGAISLSKTTDFHRLDQGACDLYHSETGRCVVCGGAVAPTAMLQRIEALLGPEHAAMLPVLTRYCTSCRGNGVFPTV